MTNRLFRGTLCASILLVTVAAAQGSGLGVFFSDSGFSDATTNFDPGPDPFPLYIVVLDCPYATVGGYECRLDFAGVAPTILGVEGPAGSGFTNFGTDQNHLVAFGQPPVTVGGAAVLAIVTVQSSAPTLTEVVMGFSTPATVPGMPAVLDGADPDGLEVTGCGLTSGEEIPGVVATLNGGGITPVESRPLSAIRNLFD